MQCEACGKDFARKDILMRHRRESCPGRRIIDPVDDMNKCPGCDCRFNSKAEYVAHLKTNCSIPGTSGTKRQHAATAAAASTSTSAKQRKTDVVGASHPRSLQYKASIVEDLEDGIQILKTAFQSRIATYRLLNPIRQNLNIHDFLAALHDKIIKLVTTSIAQFHTVKINLEFFGQYVIESQSKDEIKSFATKNFIFDSTNIETNLQELCAIIESKASEFTEKQSGWALQNILFLEVNINKYAPLRGSAPLKLPHDIQSKRAVLNIQNRDEECFKWCILAHLHPVNYTQKPERVHHYQPYADELDFTGIDFPVDLSDISRFEAQNNISVNVYGVETNFDPATNRMKSHIIGPFHLTSAKRERHVNLLLITDDASEASHYCLIRNLSRLVRSQNTRHKAEAFLCDGCLMSFSTNDKLRAHNRFDCNEVVTQLPTTDLITDKFGNEVRGNILKFQNFEKSLRVPFVIYFDFESLLAPVSGCGRSVDASTTQTHLHVPHSFAYKIVCSFNDELSTFRLYRGEDAPKKFIEWLEDDIRTIYTNYLKPIVPLDMSPAEEDAFQAATTCHLCDKPFTDATEKVRNHDHTNGRFLGAAHSICNLHFKLPPFIPAICHNLSGYDAHLFIKELADENSTLNAIAQTKERYISFSKKILVDSVEEGGKNTWLTLRFVDSFRFMASSLDKLASNLSSEDCHNVRKRFPDDDEKFHLIRQKGVFPYSYVDSFDKLSEERLPPKAAFYNNLTKKSISDSDYERAVKVWNLFECKTLGDYSDVYLESDVLILSDIFQNFRNICLKNYGLDPAQYLTAPALSWDAMLKCTGIELDLLTDISMVHFIRKGIRGGICQCVRRKAIANNKYLSEYDPTRPTSYLMYLDATNLYGAAMSQYLPCKNFEWDDPTNFDEAKIMSLSDSANEGYIFEVDLKYPSELHEKHNDLPFCPQQFVPPKGKSRKLCTTLHHKSKYVIHYQNLKQALGYGLKLDKIHRVLKFDQAPWLKKYIDLNTELRNKARNAFEKDFFKLMNNSVFGKTMESVDKRVDVRLVTSWESQGRRVGARALIARPNFKNCSIFTDTFVAIQMNKSLVKYDKPIYIGFSVLDLSKVIMYAFFYDYIKQKYGDMARLLYTDTDSLILSIECDDFYDDMKSNLDKFDTSNYADDNPYQMPKTPSILGRMKDEYKGRVLQSFYGTGAKAYCCNVEGDVLKKAKGVKRNVVNDELSESDYDAAVSTPGTEILREMLTFRSHLHEIYTCKQRKIALSHHDDKRYLLPGSTDTLSWGHKDIP